jgi:peptidoglycan hydrolase-like protein with peptidoglycan-binding domain
MSRSIGASTDGCAPALRGARGAAPGKPGGRVRPAYERPLSAAFAGRLLLVVAAGLFALSLVPTPAAAASSASPHRQRLATSSAQKTRTSTAVLARGSGYGAAHGSALVRALQRRLAGVGYVPGPIDGLYGPLTEGAVRAFQAARGLQVDGIAGPQTRAALSRPPRVLYPGTGDQGEASAPVQTLQHRLAGAGYSPGPIDGRFGPLTERAVREFQAARGLQVDGIAGRQTLTHLRLPSHPHQASHRPVHSPHAQPITPQHQRAVPSAPKNAQATRRGGSSATDWLLIIVALGLALVTVNAIGIYRRRRNMDVGQATPAVETPPGDAQAEAASEPRHHLADRVEDPGDLFNLGLSLEKRGNRAEAMMAYRRAGQQGHALAATYLGVLLEAEGDFEGAEAAYRRADEQGNAIAAFSLGVLLDKQGDLAEAVLAYVRADKRGHAAAATSIGVLLEEEGKFADAAATYRRADRRGDAAGAFNLGLLLEEQGALAGAEAAYRRAHERAEGELKRIAQVALDDLAARSQPATPLPSDRPNLYRIPDAGRPSPGRGSIHQRTRGRRHVP